MCANCGGGDRVRVRMVVPEEAGGRLEPANGIVLCRTCEMAADTVTLENGHAQRLVNFWVSRGLFDRFQEGLRTHQGSQSMGSLVRYLISKYVQDVDRFDDLDMYQDEGADVKVNVWVEKDRYNVFKTLVERRGRTVTSTLKALIMLYGEKSERLIVPKPPVLVVESEVKVELAVKEEKSEES